MTALYVARYISKLANKVWITVVYLQSVMVHSKDTERPLTSDDQAYVYAWGLKQESERWRIRKLPHTL
jgi:hypothetical protein